MGLQFGAGINLSTRICLLNVVSLNLALCSLSFWLLMYYKC
jgi:hypothetical protein